MPTRWLEAWSNGANGSEWSWSIRSHGGGKTSVSSLGVWDKRNLPYDALQRGVLSPLSKTYPRKEGERGMFFASSPPRPLSSSPPRPLVYFQGRATHGNTAGTCPTGQRCKPS